MENGDRAVQQLLHANKHTYYGKHRGVVTDNQDAEHRGRLEVRVPGVLGDTPIWALPCVPYAGKGVGFFALPDVGGMVWVEFEEGDPSYPIWCGSLWADNDLDASDAQPDIKFFKTKKFTLRIDDAAEEIHLESQSGSQIVITSRDITIKSTSVKQETDAGKKTELTNISFSVNDQALEVL
jgi:uncharacterized protein involved in type VI secretion and phage assembly